VQAVLLIFQLFSYMYNCISVSHLDHHCFHSVMIHYLCMFSAKANTTKIVKSSNLDTKAPGKVIFLFFGIYLEVLHLFI